MNMDPVVQRARNILGWNFDRTFSLCVQEVLSSLLGETSSSILLRHLQNRYSLRIEEVGRRYLELSKALEEMFGSGAEVIEAEIFKNLDKRLKEESPEP